jgi:hypothetical protein
MNRNALLIAVAVLGGATARVNAAESVAEVLDANQLASGGEWWVGKQTLELDYGYVGQGLTGTAHSVEDLGSGGFIDSYEVGPTSGALGFDGEHAWERETSGTVTRQAGGDVLALAINEDYRNRHLWWRADRGGAQIRLERGRTQNGITYAVLTVQPRGGTRFEAWFDTTTHLLTRTIEVQSTLSIRTDYLDYQSSGGAWIAHKIVTDDGTGPANRQTYTVTTVHFAAARPSTAYAAPQPALDDFSIAGGAHQTEIPFQLIDNHVYGEVSINGAPPRLFIFDTGGHDLLTPSTAQALGINPEGHQTATGAGAQTAVAGVARVTSIRVGDALLTNQTVGVLQMAAPGVEGVDEAGMIGYEFFARFVTQFDYARHVMRFIDRRYFDAATAGTAVPFELYHQLPEVRGSYEGIPGRFGIDTGSRLALTLSGPFVAQHGLRARAGKGVETIVGWGVGGPSSGFAQRGGLLHLGEVAVAAPLTVLDADKGGSGAAAAFPNNVGSALLKRFVVTFDYANYVMYLKPIPGPVEDLDTFDRAGLWLNDSPQGFKVVHVTANSPAQAAHFEPGDEVLAVDGKSSKGLKLYDVRRQLRDEAPGTEVSFTVQRGAGAPTTIRLQLTDLI